jgi:cytochrome d ubiquinol oxidase subunit I
MEDIQRRFEQQFGPGDYRPNQPVVFWSFRVMIGFGMATVGLSVLGLWLTRRKREFPRWLSRAFLLALPLPVAAAISGWLLSEIGRQPWTVAGELLTASSVSPGVSLAEVALSLAIFTVVYGVFTVAEAVLLARHVRKGVEEPATVPAAERREPQLMY